MANTLFSTKINTIKKAVTTAGTPVPVSATRIIVTDFTFQPLAANTGANMYIGKKGFLKADSIAFPKGGVYGKSSGTGKYRGDEPFDLSQVYVDGDANGDTMVIQYNKVEGDL